MKQFSPGNYSKGANDSDTSPLRRGYSANRSKEYPVTTMNHSTTTRRFIKYNSSKYIANAIGADYIRKDQI